MIGPVSDMEDLARAHPEWKPWLTVVEAVVRETDNTRWDTFVPGPTGTHTNKVPLLAGTAITIEADFVSAWTQRLIRVAAQSGAPRMTTIKRMTSVRVNEFALFSASLCYDT